MLSRIDYDHGYKFSPETCPHDEWVTKGTDGVLDSTCSKCGQYMKRYIMENNWRARIERELKELKKG